MSRSEDTIWCDGCGTEISWVPYVVEVQDFCCQNCAYGLSCQCSETMNWDEEHRDTDISIDSIYPGN